VVSRRGNEIGVGSVQMGRNMSEDTREKYLKIALFVVGVIFWLIYPLSLIWPSGWIWHGGQGAYYLQMICGIYAVLGIYLIAAARNPGENRSLISLILCASRPIGKDRPPLCGPGDQDPCAYG
jgi:hypothetical protein